MRGFQVGIVGGGASGIVAGISAKRSGLSCCLLEKMTRFGRKILVSGNGRCNLLNEDLNESYYNQRSRPIVKSVLSQFGLSDIKKFFKEIGLEIYLDHGRAFPVTNQSSSVLKVLELEVERLSIPVKLSFDVTAVSKKNGRYEIVSGKGDRVTCDSVVISSGGMSYPALGSDGSLFKILEGLGHTIVDPVPVAVPLVVKHAMCHMLQGQKIFAEASCLIRGRKACQASGDVLFTKYGLSGTAILDISEAASIAIHRTGIKEISVSIDMVPFMDEDALAGELTNRLRRGVAGKNLTVGILPNKFSDALKDTLGRTDAAGIASALKNMTFKVSGTRGWNEADFTAGGVSTDEVGEGTLESKLKKGLYFAGEVIDVNGRRGGYNLAWAWASGFVAGMAGGGVCRK